MAVLSKVEYSTIWLQEKPLVQAFSQTGVQVNCGRPLSIENLFFIYCIINCSFEQALWHVLYMAKSFQTVWLKACSCASCWAFRTLQPFECHQIKSIQYSTTGDAVLIAAGNSLVLMRYLPYNNCHLIKGYQKGTKQYSVKSWFLENSCLTTDLKLSLSPGFLQEGVSSSVSFVTLIFIRPAKNSRPSLRAGSSRQKVEFGGYQFSFKISLFVLMRQGSIKAVEYKFNKRNLESTSCGFHYII